MSLLSRAAPLRSVVAPVALGAVLTLDAVQDSERHSVLVTGLLDEPAHLATAGLALVALAGPPWLERHRDFTTAALIASMAIDVDHLPLYIGLPGWAAGGRPVTHSLATVVVLVAAAALLARPRPWLLGAGAGVLLHFVRDVATGPGLPLLWPASTADLRAPYRGYLAVLVVLTVVAAVRMAMPPRSRHPRRQPVTWPSPERG